MQTKVFAMNPNFDKCIESYFSYVTDCEYSMSVGGMWTKTLHPVYLLSHTKQIKKKKRKKEIVDNYTTEFID